MRNLPRGLIATGCVFLVSMILVRAQPADSNPRAAVVFANSCAACHGADLRGGRGPGLLNPQGAPSADRLVDLILSSHLDSGLAPQQGIVSPATARTLAVYIRERIEFAIAAGEKWSLNEVDTGRTVTTERYVIRIETVVKGLESPWAMAFLPDGRMIVTEKVGRLRIVKDLSLIPEPVDGIPTVVRMGQGGLLDVALDPNFQDNGWVYLTFAEAGRGQYAMTAMTRGTIVGGLWLRNQTLFRAPPETHRQSIADYGSAIAFDASGYLYFTIGDRGFRDDAQDPSRPDGKIHRMHADGRIPADNPYPFSPFPSIWTLGHRNSQGLAVNRATGELWEVEHGPRGGDELNVITGGNNYGWPLISSGLTQGGLPISIDAPADKFTPPVYQWTPSIAPSSMIFYDADKFTQWKGNLFVGSLIHQDLRRLEIREHKVIHEEILFKGLGRVRDVATGPDGNIYVVLNQPDRIARLTMVERRTEDRQN